MDLVIMAAGMGSRFGGLKQIEPMNENGDFIIDYSIFDAIKCGFDKVVFIIKEENYDIFRQTVGKRVEDKIRVEYVFQRKENIPAQFMVPKDRVKPWGTGHAILACKDVVKDNFAIINADDFYGYDAFKTASDFIKEMSGAPAKKQFAVIGYKAKNTLSEFGAAKRGVCVVEGDKLKHIDESSVERVGNKIVATPLDGSAYFEVSDDRAVSMNMWCLHPSIFKELEKRFIDFLGENLESNPLKCEYLMPTVISDMIEDNLIEVAVKNTSAKWYGVTYKEDKPSVVASLKELTDKGVYPRNLWKNDCLMTKQ